MGRYELETSTFALDIEAMGWIRKLRTLQPAVVNSVIASVVSLLAIWGINATEIGGQIGESVILIVAIVNILFGFLTKSEVVPLAKVAAFFNSDTGQLQNGPASSYVHQVDDEEPETS